MGIGQHSGGGGGASTNLDAGPVASHFEWPQMSQERALVAFLGLL